MTICVLINWRKLFLICQHFLILIVVISGMHKKEKQDINFPSAVSQLCYSFFYIIQISGCNSDVKIISQSSVIDELLLSHCDFCVYFRQTNISVKCVVMGMMKNTCFCVMDATMRITWIALHLLLLRFLQVIGDVQNALFRSVASS